MNWLREGDSIAHSGNEGKGLSSCKCKRTDEEVDGVANAEVTANWRREAIGPAVPSTTPQFMTNWLGSYIPDAAAMLIALGVVP